MRSLRSVFAAIRPASSNQVACEVISPRNVKVNLPNVLARKTEPPFSRDCLLGFLTSEHNDENLLFWEAIKEWRADTVTRSPYESLSRAKDIYVKYIKPGAVIEINISDVLRSRVKLCLEEADHALSEEVNEVTAGTTALSSPVLQPLIEMMIAAQSEVYSLLRDIYVRFMYQATTNLSARDANARLFLGVLGLLVAMALFVYFTVVRISPAVQISQLAAWFTSASGFVQYRRKV